MTAKPNCVEPCSPRVRVTFEGQAPAERQAAAPSRLRVLVIDDEYGLRRCVASMIRGAGHQVEEASSSMEGVRRLQAAPLDVVLTDLRMPGGSGWEVVRAAHALHPGPPVLVMTADVSALKADGAEAALAAGILVKPFAMNDLLGRLAKVEEALRTLQPSPAALSNTAAAIE